MIRRALDQEPRAALTPLSQPVPGRGGAPTQCTVNPPDHTLARASWPCSHPDQIQDTAQTRAYQIATASKTTQHLPFKAVKRPSKLF
ncbi:hypothetical protein BDN72DRAFT_848084 [Pluteus cervinus]|uniref:Uncharacterized protein n=1 Tax=Pluteus cervinus TaxID=181527 RepID=A0ACD3ABT6_9AGAR|nr:hypothetical protein BDN72DRAFT_848084 [Pluteus cervinus]